MKRSNMFSMWLASVMTTVALGCNSTKDAGTTTASGAAADAKASAASGGASGTAAANDGSLAAFEHPPAIGGEVATATEALQKLQDFGPPEYQMRVPSCRKMPVSTLGKILVQLGVDINANPAAGQLPTAGKLYRDGQASLSGPNFQGRIQESNEVNVAAASKMFDIFVQAAPEIISKAAASCNGATLFDAATDCSKGDGGCKSEGLSCIMGVPATPKHLALCNYTVCRRSPDNLDEGRRVAVASILAAVHTCE